MRPWRQVGYNFKLRSQKNFLSSLKSLVAEAHSQEDSSMGDPMDSVSSKMETSNTTLCLLMAPLVTSSSSLAGLKRKNSLSSGGWLTMSEPRTSLGLA